MSESRQRDNPPKACGRCKFYETTDGTCRIRSAPGPFPERKPSEFCFEFAAASNVMAAAALDNQLIDQDADWTTFVTKLQNSSRVKHKQAEKKLRQVADKYRLTKLRDFETITTAHMMSVPGIGKSWSYQLFEILGECGIFNGTVINRKGDQI